MISSVSLLQQFLLYAFVFIATVVHPIAVAADGLPEPTPDAKQEDFVSAEVMFRYRSSFRFIEYKYPSSKRPVMKPPPCRRLPSPRRRRPPPPKRRPPPPKRRPPPPPPPPRPRPKLYETESQLHIVCPEMFNGNFYQEAPNCTVPITTIAVGREAELIRESYGIKTGYVAKVQLRPVPDSGRRSALAARGVDSRPTRYKLANVSSFTYKGDQKEIYIGVPIVLYTIVYVLNFADCSNAPGWTNLPISEVEKFFFNTTSPLPNNLENYYTKCTYNKTHFFRQNFIIVPQPINITCRYNGPNDGTNTSVNWDSSTRCEASELAAWDRIASQQAWALTKDPRNARLIYMLNRGERRRNIYILPPSVPCNWAGFGDVTCVSSTCNSFVRASSPTTLSYMDMHVVMHEAMHNYGLEHAARNDDLVGDTSDVMGDVGDRQGLLCPSAPHLYRIGVAMPINKIQGVGRGLYGNLTASNFSSGYPIRDLVLPLASLADDHMIAVNLGVLRDAPEDSPSTWVPTYYLSYRIKNNDPFGYDSALDPQYSGKVLVHSYSGAQMETTFGAKPNLLQAVEVNSVWRTQNSLYDDTNQHGGSLVITVTEVNATHATVTLCRAKRQVELDCQDGLDDDCDGLTDGEDDDCRPKPPRSPFKIPPIKG